MRILAFDLSLSNSGWVVGEVENGKLSIVEFGSIGTKRFAKRSHGFRLNHISEELKKLYKKFIPDKVVKERSFSNSRIKATQAIWKVNGVWELVNHMANKDDYTEIAPTSVKKQVTGDGRAKKKDVEDAILKEFRDLTGQPTIKFRNDDEADAVGVLIAYCRMEGLI